MSNLESCPFCGSNELKVKNVWQTYKFVACNACKAGGPVRKDEKEAIGAWNKRADQLKLDFE